MQSHTKSSKKAYCSLLVIAVILSACSSSSDPAPIDDPAPVTQSDLLEAFNNNQAYPDSISMTWHCDGEEFGTEFGFLIGRRNQDDYGNSIFLPEYFNKTENYSFDYTETSPDTLLLDFPTIGTQDVLSSINFRAPSYFTANSLVYGESRCRYLRGATASDRDPINGLLPVPNISTFMNMASDPDYRIEDEFSTWALTRVVIQTSSDDLFGRNEENIDTYFGCRREGESEVTFGYDFLRSIFYRKVEGFPLESIDFIASDSPGINALFIQFFDGDSTKEIFSIVSAESRELTAVSSIDGLITCSAMTNTLRLQ